MLVPRLVGAKALEIVYEQTEATGVDQAELTQSPKSAGCRLTRSAAPCCELLLRKRQSHVNIAVISEPAKSLRKLDQPTRHSGQAARSGELKTLGIRDMQSMQRKIEQREHDLRILS